MNKPTTNTTPAKTSTRDADGNVIIIGDLVEAKVPGGCEFAGKVLAIYSDRDILIDDGKFGIRMDPTYKVWSVKR